jgi:hypothetical protein
MLLARDTFTGMEISSMRLIKLLSITELAGITVMWAVGSYLTKEHFHNYCTLLKEYFQKTTNTSFQRLSSFLRM